MKENSNNKIKWLHLRLSKAEYDQLHKAFGQTTENKLSGYARKILLGKPMIASVRDASVDDMMTEIIKLRNELNAIGTNFNQAVKKLHSTSAAQELEHWLVLFQMDKIVLEKHYAEIEIQIKKMAAKWLQ